MPNANNKMISAHKIKQHQLKHYGHEAYSDLFLLGMLKLFLAAVAWTLMDSVQEDSDNGPILSNFLIGAAAAIMVVSGFLGGTWFDKTIKYAWHKTNANENKQAPNHIFIQCT